MPQVVERTRARVETEAPEATVDGPFTFFLTFKLTQYAGTGSSDGGNGGFGGQPLRVPHPGALS